MSHPHCQVVLTEKPLPVAPPSLPTQGEEGAIVDFYGVVRGREENTSIRALEYEAYPAMAKEQLERIVKRLGAKYGAIAVQVAHRLGVVPVGEPSLHVRVHMPHREEAFALAETIIDEIKRDVPIWKRAG